MALEFPWRAWMEAQKIKASQKDSGWADIIGEALKTGGAVAGGVVQGNRLKAQDKNIVSWLNSQANASGPQQKTLNVGGRPNTPIASYDPASAQVTPAMTLGDPQRQQLFSGLAQAPAMIRNKALPKIFEQGFKGLTATKPQANYWVNPNDPTEVSPLEKPGYIKYTTSSADAGGKVTGAASSRMRNQAQQGRVEAWNRSIDTRQIDEITKTIGFTPKMVSNLQQTATRAVRGLEVVKNPNVTWQQLGAAGVDFAGIMQGGAPHVGEVLNTQFPNWNQKVAQWQTYIEGNNPANVPPEIRQQMVDMLQGVAQTDFKFIQSNNKFNKTMLSPTIRGGFDPNQKTAMQQMEKVMTTTPTMGSAGGSYDDPGKERRYQEWKKANGF